MYIYIYIAICSYRNKLQWPKKRFWYHAPAEFCRSLDFTTTLLSSSEQIWLSMVSCLSDRSNLQSLSETIGPFKVHTDRTRFGNATRIFNFQWDLTSIFFYVFQIFGTTWAILAIWSAYLVKILSVDVTVLFVNWNWKFASRCRIAFGLYGP
jgi:hypothetical protein